MPSSSAPDRETEAMQAFASLPIRTARLELRPLREADVAPLFEIHSDPQVMKYWDAPLWKSDERGSAMVARDPAMTTREDPRNERSMRLLERLGFSRQGLFRERCIVDGEISDAAMHGLVRRAWRRAPAPPSIR